jgi:hypothetical protein
MEIIKLPISEQEKIFQRTGKEIGLSAVAVEKDIWVTAVLRALFSLPLLSELGLVRF